MTTLDNNIADHEMVGQPELFKFSFGDVTEYYTSWPTSLTFLGNLYKAAPIKRGSFTMDSQYKSVNMSIAGPPTEAFQRYLVSSPAAVTAVTVYQAVIDNLADYIILFNGSVKTVSFDNHQAQADCISNSDILDEPLPGVIYQSYCNHTVFDSGCGLAATSWKIQIDSITIPSAGNYISHVDLGLANYTADYFGMGVVSSLDGQFMRFITKHDYTNDRVYLHIPFGTSEVIGGDSVYVYPGCDGSPETCLNRFNNLLNYLGMPYIPSNNPVLWSFTQPIPY